MSAFFTLSSLARSLITTWAVGLCIGFLINGALAILQRRRARAGAAMLFFLCPYCLFNVAANVSGGNLGQPVNPIAHAAAVWPTLWFLLALALATLCWACQFRMGLRYGRTHITPASIKEAADKAPAGFCYYHDSGQPYLINRKMSELAFAITGHALQNGTSFFRELSQRLVLDLSDEAVYRLVLKLPDGSVCRFSHRDLSLGGESFHELIADDVTELYRKTELLREDNLRLQDRNQHMKEYGRTIDDTVRREEILKTKIRIHDEMNRHLLTTDHAIHSGSEAERQQVLNTWQKNILLLGMEAEPERESGALEDLTELALLIGIRLVFDGTPKTEDAAVLRLFVLAAQEAMTNAVKHAGAAQLFVKVREDARVLTLCFTNDGAPPAGPVRETGGLGTLRRRLEGRGGSLTVQARPEYALTITIPKGGRQDGL